MSGPAPLLKKSLCQYYHCMTEGIYLFTIDKTMFQVDSGNIIWLKLTTQCLSGMYMNSLASFYDT